MDDRSNTIAGWVLAGGIVALGLSIVTGMYFHPEAPEKEGFAVVAEASGEAGGAAAVPIATLLATADIAKGEALGRISGPQWVRRMAMFLALLIPTR